MGSLFMNLKYKSGWGIKHRKEKQVVRSAVIYVYQSSLKRELYEWGSQALKPGS